MTDWAASTDDDIVDRFAMIHRSWAVNRVLPVSRRRVSALWECFAE